jgi:hypothetical protein
MHGGRIDGRGPPRNTYTKPRLERLGTFRELTRSGGEHFTDMFTTNGDGCAMNSSSSYTCNLV